MKSICLLLCFLLINSIQLVIGDDKSESDALLMKCKDEVGASQEDVQEILDKKLPTTRSGFCVLTCLYEDAGIIKDGKFVVAYLNKVIEGTLDSSISSMMAEKFFAQVTNDCKYVQNNDKCLLSKDIIMCAAKSIKRHQNLLNEKEL